MPTNATKRPRGLGRRRRAFDQDAQARRVSAMVALYGKGSPAAALQLIAAAGINAITSASTQEAAHEAYDKTVVAVRLQIAVDGLEAGDGEALEASLSILRDEQIQGLLAPGRYGSDFEKRAHA